MFFFRVLAFLLPFDSPSGETPILRRYASFFYPDDASLEKVCPLVSSSPLRPRYLSSFSPLSFNKLGWITRVPFFYIFFSLYPLNPSSVFSHRINSRLIQNFPCRILPSAICPSLTLGSTTSLGLFENTFSTSWFPPQDCFPLEKEPSGFQRFIDISLPTCTGLFP